MYGGVAIQSTLFAYLAIRDTTLLDDGKRADYDQFFQHQAELLEQAAVLRGNDTPLDGTPNRNVPFAANVTALTIARAFPNDPDMQALDARLWPTLEWQLANWWEADGGWGENTQNYGFSMLESLILLAETSLRNGGPDLYTQVFNGRDIHLMCRFYLETVTPEGSVPALNDTNFYPVDPGLFRLCGFRTNDPELYFAEDLYNAGRHRSYGVDATTFSTPFHLLSWVNIDNQLAKTPDHTSILLADTGAAILRSGWGRDDQYALLQFTASRVHEEYSYGTLYLYAHGPWLIGNGYHIPAGRPTDQHSTLSLDNANQTYTGGEVVAFADLGVTGIAGVTSHSYPSLQHTRLVLWNKDRSQWIVVDDAVGDSSRHTLQQRWYVWGDAILTDENTWSFEHKNNNYILTIQMLPGLPATYTGISRRYDWEQWVSNADGVRMDVAYPGRPVRLVASLSVSMRGNTAEASIRGDSPEGTRIDAPADDGSRTWLLPPIGMESSGIDGYTLTGTAGCVTLRGEAFLGYCLMNGTSLTRQGQNLVMSEDKLYLEASFVAGKLYLDIPGETSVTFYWPEPVTAIMEAGAPLEYMTDAGLVTIRVGAGQHTLEINP